MYDIEEGKIIMNGINIKDLTLKELRSKIVKFIEIYIEFLKI